MPTVKTTTFVAGLLTTGMVAPMVLKGPINGAAFQVYVEQVLVPALQPGDTVILDNLSSHKGPDVQAGIESPVQGSGTCRLTAPIQPDRERHHRAQVPAAQGRRAQRQSPVVGHRCRRRRLHPTGMH